MSRPVTPEATTGSASRATTTTTHQSTDPNRSTVMYEDLVRAHQSARLKEAQQLRTGHQLVRARRLSRKAERAAQQARLALARVL